jgi:hypothetical protein
VSGRTGSCRAVLDRDPASNANLQFQGAIPLVRETPSRTFFVGLIQSPADRLPFFVVVDLDIQRYTSVNVFEPTDASNVVVLGVGADPDSDTGFMVVKYEEAGNPVVEGLFLDLEGRITGRATISGADEVEEDGIAGYLQSIDGDIVIGLIRATADTEARLLVFDRRTGNGRVENISGILPVGVHRFDDRLYLVGSNGSAPGIAPLSRTGDPSSALTWDASNSYASAVDDVVVLDDRSDPRRTVRWTGTSSAIGPYHFVSEHSPDVYADGTTGWLIAGPSFTVSGEPQTSVAFGPVGISYP